MRACGLGGRNLFGDDYDDDGIGGRESSCGVLLVWEHAINRCWSLLADRTRGRQGIEL